MLLPRLTGEITPPPADGLKSEGLTRKARILLADDNADMRDYVRRLLNQQYEVTAAEDGEAALAVIQHSPPDLVLTDVMMPRLDGFGLLKAIRSDAKTSGIPVIILSARAGEESKVEGLERGADDYLVKPFSARELTARVAAHVAMAALRKEASAREAQEKRSADLRLIVDTVPGFVWVMTAAGEVELVNRQMLEYFGKTLEELKGGAASDAVHPDDLSHALAAWKYSVETGGPYDFEGRLRRADGTYRWFRTRGLPLRDAEGRIIRWYSLLTDIDDRKQAEEKLRRSEAYLAEAQKLSHTGSFAWDVSSGETYWSRESYRIFEYEPTAKVTIELILQRTHPEDRAAVQQLIDRVSRGRTEFDFEHRLLIPDGSVKYLRVGGVPQGISGAALSSRERLRTSQSASARRRPSARAKRVFA